MRIRHIESWREAVPLSRPYSIAGHTFDSVDLLFLRLATDEGQIGLGSASPADFVTGETLEACEAALEPDALADLVGRDPRLAPNRPGIHERGPSETPAADAAVDMALWDLHGRCLERPVADLLGRHHNGLPTSVTLGISSVAETLREAEELVGNGFDHLKVKLGDEVELDLERLARLRERFGTGVELRVDVNQGYGPREVERLFAASDGLGLELIEQPLARDGEAGLEGLASSPQAPLAADESLHDVRDAMRWGEVGSPYQVFNIKLMKCGGISPALAISAVAETAERDLMWGCMDESRISIAAALHAAYASRRTRYLDLDGSFDLARDPAAGGFELRDGKLWLLDEPGLGVRIG